MKSIPALMLLLVAVNVIAQDQYTLVFLHKKADSEELPKEEVEKLMEGHLANMERLAREDRLLAAGPFGGGGGLFIMNSGSRQEVEQWISSDPGIRAGRWKIEMVSYTPLYGGICPVGEEYEMVNYTFVRFSPMISKFTASTYPGILDKHHEYLKAMRSTGNVITEATFGKDDGGMLVMKGEVDEAIFLADPGVQEGLMTTEVKTLYIAKGSFCEAK